MITSDEYRNGIKNLMVDWLGFRWAREHVLPYGGLLEIPEAELPGVYSIAQLDASEVISGVPTAWWPTKINRELAP